MSISEQVKELRELANDVWLNSNEKFGIKINQAADTIEALSAKLADMERPAEDCGGGWIYCGDGKNLPEEKINSNTRDFYEYQVTFQSDDVADVRHYKFGKGHWWNCGECMDKYVIAWRQNIEPYHEP
nr:hypothetical protein [uncultured Acetatifactor sp.]